MISWTTVIWSINAGICLSLAAVHLLVWFSDRKIWASLSFALWAVAVAISAVFELAMMHAQSPSQFGELMRWIHVPLGAATVAYILFVSQYLQAGRLWLLWSIYGLAALQLLVNFLSLPNVNFSEINALQHIPMWGDMVAVPVGVVSPWEWISRVQVVLILLFILDAAIVAWRKRRKRQVYVMGVALISSSIGSILFAEMALQGMSAPMTISFPSMITILVIAYELSSNLMRANHISRELHQSQKRMNMAVWAANLGLWEWDVVRDKIWANQVARNRSGVGEKEHIDFDRFLQTVHSDDREATRLAVQSVLEKEKDILIEYREVNPKGEQRWIEVLGQVERDAKGKPVLLRGVSLDTTARKQAEIALKESEARLREAQRIASIGNWELDMLTNSLTWSDEVFRIFEIDKEHFGASYETFLAAVHPDDRDLVNSAYKKSLEIHEPYNIIHRLLLPDGRIKYVQERCETYFNPEGKPLRSVGTVQDVTERINVQEERRELRHELAHLNRIMTINELATSLAHEINQPLGAIMNNVAAAKTICSRPEGRSEEIVEILEDVIEDANRASQIVRKVRGVVKKGDSRKAFEILNMNVKVDEVITLLHSTLNLNNIDVHLDKQPNLLPLRGDRVRLEQVIVNLVTNAIEAMKENPEKTLTIRTAMHSPEMIIVSVSNSGPGIDAEIRERLFEPFFSTKKSGLGMGLRICQSIVEEHGGRIWLENSTEDGTTVSFTIKAHQGYAA